MRAIAVIATMAIWVTTGLSQISVSGHFERDTAVIGDRIDFILSIKTPSDVRIERVLAAKLDSVISAIKTNQSGAESESSQPEVGDYQIVSYGRWDREPGEEAIGGDGLHFDTTRVGNNYLLENRISFQFWDPGLQILVYPEVEFSLDEMTSLESSKGYGEVFIKSPFQQSSEPVDSLGLAPIKPIIREKKNITDYLPFLYVLGAAALIFTLWYFWKNIKRSTKETDKTGEVILPAHVIALEKLDQLSQKRLWQQGLIKEFQSELTFIIREYLENRYDIRALESTTDEIMRDLKRISFDRELGKMLLHILQVADMVKFAKAKPEIFVHEEFLQRSVTFIESTKLIPEPDTESSINDGN